MPRCARGPLGVDPYQVNSRGNRQQLIFLDSVDRRCLLAFLEEEVTRRGWKLLSYCLMGNHFHLLCMTPRCDLSAGMHRLNGRYARWFNCRHGFTGHLFEERFYANQAEGHGHLLELYRYLALNPVRAGLAKTAPDWPWSSYGARPVPRFVDESYIVDLFGPDPAVARGRLQAFVEE